MSTSLVWGNVQAIALAAFFIIAAACYQSNRKFDARSQGLPLPPGPKPAFLLGNLFEIIAKRPWYRFAELKKQYGNIMYLEALGNRILVLNSTKAAHDLLEKRATIYSDRPSFTMIGELIGLDKSLPMLPYAPEFKKQRKLCHSGLSPTAVKKYYGIQEEAIASYVSKLLKDPECFISELRLTAGRIVLSVTYGFPVEMADHSYLDEAEATMEMIEKGTVMGAYLVDIIPQLKYLPAWIPFNNIHRIADSGRKLLFSMVDRPYQHVKRTLADGNASPSFTAECLMGSDGVEDEDSIRWAAGSMYGAGGESSYATILTFIYAMAMYPDVQARIHEEIDRTIGVGRLPSLDDQDQLPYVRATIKETMRWKPALPMSIPRMTAQDDHYNGYFIPAGTIILPNVWAMSRDDESGIPSSEFSPERFLEPQQNESLVDPAVYAFGFGRRACPGKYLGENNIFLFVTYLMSTLSISRKRDAQGKFLPLDPPYTAGLVSFPVPFEVDFSPRSEDRVALITSKTGSLS